MQGYKKSGHWSVKSAPPFHWAAYLRASRFGGKSHAVFWIDLLVFHEGWYELMHGPSKYPGLKEGTPALVNEPLGLHCVPRLPTFEINDDTDVDSLTKQIQTAALDYALPLFERCATLEGVLAYYVGSPYWPQLASSAAGIALLLDQEDQARKYAQLAKDVAPHENTLAWLEKREKVMWSNFRSSGRAKSARRSPAR